jgi:CPA2 family monovalent cation:H+ antiporter-2
MLIDLNFLLLHPVKIAFLVGAVFICNTFINAGIFRALGSELRDSLYAGALLAQIGELSFLVAALGYRTTILSEFSYQATITTISLSLLLSPTWIWLIKKVGSHYLEQKYVRP